MHSPTKNTQTQLDEILVLIVNKKWSEAKEVFDALSDEKKQECKKYMTDRIVPEDEDTSSEIPNTTELKALCNHLLTAGRHDLIQLLFLLDFFNAEIFFGNTTFLLTLCSQQDATFSTWLCTHSIPDQITLTAETFTQVFNYACQQNQLPIAKTLWSCATQEQKQAAFTDFTAFDVSCQEGNLPILHWLWSICESDDQRQQMLMHDDFTPINLAALHKQTPVLQWIGTLKSAGFQIPDVFENILTDVSSRRHQFFPEVRNQGSTVDHSHKQEPGL